jgi:hypothetical protein
MNAKQFTAALEALKIESQGEAAAVLGIGRRSVIRYAGGDAEVPESVSRLIAMLVKHGIPKEFAA